MSRLSSLSLLMLVAVVSTVAMAQMLPVCLPNACANHKCAELAKECQADEATRNATHYLLEPKGGYCGCCPNCVKLLQENEPCQAFLVIGVPHRNKCDANLHCNLTSHKCVKNPTMHPNN